MSPDKKALVIPMLHGKQEDFVLPLPDSSIAVPSN
jgi:hypothetical protein